MLPIAGVAPGANSAWATPHLRPEGAKARLVDGTEGYMARAKTEVDLDEQLLRAAEELSRRTGRPLADLIEEALRRLLNSPWQQAWGDNPEPLSEDEALARASSELDAARRDADGLSS